MRCARWTFGPNDVSLDVRTNRQHPFLEHEVQIATSPDRRVVCSYAKICCAFGLFGINRGYHLDIWRGLRATG
jgi:hypothetical protein